jgi:ABC-type methionine transport system permease subunit
VKNGFKNFGKFLSKEANLLKTLLLGKILKYLIQLTENPLFLNQRLKANAVITLSFPIKTSCPFISVLIMVLNPRSLNNPNCIRGFHALLSLKTITPPSLRRL